MAYHEQYFRHSEGSYTPAITAKRKNSFSLGQLEKQLRFILVEVVPNLVKLLVLLVPALLRSFAQFCLPARRKSISGQLALVTGGANGLGKALCMRLAQEGCSVAVADIDVVSARSTAEEVRRRFAVKAEAFQVDVADHKSVAQLRQNVEASLGPVDILVNNAGLLALLSLCEGKPEDVQRIVNVNLVSHFWTIREFKDGMAERRRGHIVAICSMLGVLPCGRAISYCTTKFGVRGLMASLNEELAMDGLADDIHTSCVYPAGIITRKQFVDLMKELSVKIPWHTPEHVANVVVNGVLTNKTDIIPSSWFVRAVFNYISVLPTPMVRAATNVIMGNCPPLTSRSQ